MENHETDNDHIESENTAYDIDITNPDDLNNLDLEENANSSQLGNEKTIDNYEIAEADVESTEENDEELDINETIVENRNDKDNNLDDPEE